MINTVKYLLLFGITAILVSSCLFQYDDGPIITFRSKIQRIQGAWKLGSFTADGIDSLQEYNTYASGECKFSCQKADGFEEWYDYTIQWGDSAGFGSRYWHFDDDFLVIGSGYVIDSLNKFAFLRRSQPSSRTEGTWKINKLTHKDFWVEMYYNNRVYALKFER